MKIIQTMEKICCELPLDDYFMNAGLTGAELKEYSGAAAAMKAFLEEKF